MDRKKSTFSKSKELNKWKALEKEQMIFPHVRRTITPEVLLVLEYCGLIFTI